MSSEDSPPKQLDLDAIAASPPAVEDSERAAEESDALNLLAVQERIRTVRLANDETEGNQRLRIEYADKIFCLMLAWMIFLSAVIIASGKYSTGFHLDNSILIALITTGTGSVIGVFLIVVNYLFPKR